MDTKEFTSEQLIDLLHNTLQAIDDYQKSHGGLFKLDALKLHIISAIAAVKKKETMIDTSVQ